MTTFQLDVVTFAAQSLIPITTHNNWPALFISGPVAQCDGVSGFLNLGRIVPRDERIPVGDGEGHDNPLVMQGAIEYCRNLIRHGTDVFGLIAVSTHGQRVAWRGNVDLYGGPIDSEEFPAPKSHHNPGWAEF